MNTKAKVAFGAAFVVGVILGNVSDPEPVTEYKVIHDTETVIETETIEVLTTPEACGRLVIYAKRISESGGQLDATTAGVLDIMSRLRIAVATGDSNTANALETELRELTTKTTRASELMGESQYYFINAAEACLKGTE